MAEQNQIEGIKLTLGGREFIVLPLTLRALRELAPRFPILQGMGDVPTGDQIDVVSDIVYSALLRNHPDLTRDELEELLDLENLAKALMAVMGASPVAAQVLEALHG
jgi:hypothetical protein